MPSIDISFFYFNHKKEKDIWVINSLLETMMKKSPLYTASVAAVLFFIIYITLKFSLAGVLDWQGAFIGAVVFWIVIFVIHVLLKRQYG